MRLLFELVAAIAFTGTTGFLFREQFEKNRILSTVVALILFASTYLVIEEFSKRLFGPTHIGVSSTTHQPSTPLPLSIPTPENIVPVDTTIKVGVASRRQTSDWVEVAYSLINMGVVAATDIDTSLWVVTDAGLRKIHSRSIAFLNRGDTLTNDKLTSPSEIARLVTCVAFTANKRRVERIEFFTNEDQSPQQRLSSPLRQFKEPILQIDGSAQLCKGMPRSAGTLRPPRVATQNTKYCITVNGREICE